MSVIAKLVIRGVHQYGMGNLVELSCIAPNDLMAAYAESESDKLFTKYSPSGEMKLHQPQGFLLGQQDDQFYVMVLSDVEVEDKSFPGSWGRAKLRVVSVTDFGSDSRRFEFCSLYKDEEKVGIDNFNWKMSIDNPPASAQFQPARDDYWMAIYSAKNFTRDQAIAAAHCHG